MAPAPLPQIRSAVQDGDVAGAIERVNDMDPELLDLRPGLVFRLHLQRLIELIRARRLEDALELAQTELAHRGQGNPEFLAEMEQVMALLAFADPHE